MKQCENCGGTGMIACGCCGGSGEEGCDVCNGTGEPACYSPEEEKDETTK